MDEINQVFLNGINDNMASLVQSGMYGVINTYYTTTNGFYVIQFLAEAYTQQNNTEIDGQFISAGELVVKAKCLCYMKESTNWYWKKQPLQQNIMVPTCTILHPCLDFDRITYVQDIPKTVCNRIQEKHSIQIHPICMIYADYDYIWDEIER